MNSCGISEEELKEQQEMALILKSRSLAQCKRCNQSNPSVLLQKKDAFCSLCFLDYVAHKFRSTIGKSKLLGPKHRVLLAVSGETNSIAMLHLSIDSLQNKNTHNRLFFQPFVLYIDETILNDPLKNSNKESQEIISLIRSYDENIRIFITQLESFFSDCFFYEEYKGLLPKKNEKLIKKFNDQLNSLTSLTAKEEFIRQIKIKLQLEIAKVERMDYIFLGSNATRLSIQLLTDVAQGKGNQVDSEICFVDERDSNVKILKPMRELTSKEVVFWNHFKNNKFIKQRNLSTGKSKKASLSKMTEQFINGLQNNFPSTTYTITRIGDKLQSLKSSETKCNFCQAQVEIFVEGEVSAKDSLLHSNQLLASRAAIPTFYKKFCYSCNILLRESKEPDQLMQGMLNSRVKKVYDESDFRDCLISQHDE